MAVFTYVIEEIWLTEWILKKESCTDGIKDNRDHKGPYNSDLSERVAERKNEIRELNSRMDGDPCKRNVKFPLQRVLFFKLICSKAPSLFSLTTNKN